MRAIDPKNIEDWLREIGCDPQRVADPITNWHFNVAYPTAPHQLSVLNPKKPASAVIIASATTVSQEHRTAFDQLDEDGKEEFIVAFQETLNRDFVEYMLQGVSNQPLLCPTAFQITSIIYADGLSIDNLAFRMSCAYKTEIAAILCIQRHLGRGRSSGSGQFDFKRLGIQ